MSLRLGDTVPDFEAETTQGRIKFHEWLGNSWGILFSHPKDFTPVCTTELGRVSHLQAEFLKRNVKTIALSVDSVNSHNGWIPDINETQSTNIDYPIIADEDRKISVLYNMLDPTNPEKATGLPLTVRSVFVIDPAKKLRLTLTYPASTGRNFNEILRVVDSLQLTDKAKVATPADWQQGGDVIIIPSISDEQAKTLFPQGWTAPRPYLRSTSLSECSK